MEFYTKKLGFRAGFTWGDPPSIAGVNLGSVQMFLEHGTPNPTGCEVYFVVGNADELYEFQRAGGVEIVEHRATGVRSARLQGAGPARLRLLGFGHHIFNAGPAIEIERVDVPVRLEKRLAASAARPRRATSA